MTLNLLKSPIQLIVVAIFSDKPIGLNLGDHVQYQFWVENVSDFTMSEVLVSDETLGPIGMPIVLASGVKDVSSFNLVYTITEDDVSNGVLRKVVYVHGKTPTGYIVENKSECIYQM